MPDRCLLCSIGPVTGEHVIAKSLSKRLWEVSPVTPEHGAPVEPKPGATRFHTNRIIDALSSWLHKTALLVPLALSPRARWPQHLIDECQAFYIRRRPAVGAPVWIGRYDLRDNFPELVGRADVSELNYRRQGRDFISNQILVSLGYFLGIVVLWNGVPPDDVNIANRTDDRLLEIWPMMVGHIKWPPDHTFTYEELTGLSNMIPAAP